MRCYELRRDALREGACANPDDISTVPLTPLFRVQTSFLLSRDISPPSLPPSLSHSLFYFSSNSVRNVKIRIVVTGHRDKSGFSPRS